MMERTRAQLLARVPPRLIVTYSFVREIVDQALYHRISMLAKQAAYSLLYALPAFVLALVSIAGIVDKHVDANLSDALLRAIDGQAPASLQPLLEQIVQQAVIESSESTAAAVAIVSLGVALWSVAGAAGAIVYACNCVYNIVDERSFVRRKLLTMAMTVIGILAMLFSALVFVAGGVIGGWIATIRGEEGVVSEIFTRGRDWTIVLVPAALFMVYYVAPNLTKSARWVLPGTVAAALLIFIALAATDVLIRLSNPGKGFGAAGSVLVLLWLLYLVCAILVLGAQINAVCARRFDDTTVEFMAAHPERLLASTRRP